MPRGDKTGPRGEGAMTGRGMGFCAGYDAPGYMNPGFNPRARGEFGYGRGMGRGMGGGMGRGMGRGMGFGMGYSPAPESTGSRPYSSTMPPPTPEEEIRGLKQQAELLMKQFEDISKKIKELEKNKS